MGVIYSIGAKFAGGGIGNIAYHAIRGLHQHNLLQSLLCGSYAPSDIPQSRIKSMGCASKGLRKAAIFDKTRKITHWHNIFYDRWASKQISSCDLFHAWGNFCLSSLQRAKSLGMVTIVERASSHPRFQSHLLQEEYARWGLRFEQPESNLIRAEKEFTEADYVLIPSNFVRQSFLGMGFPEEKLIQIPFGVDINRFQPKENKAERPFTALFVGQVTFRKGIMDLLQAWNLLGWQGAELQIVGQVDKITAPLIQPYRANPTIKWANYTPNPVTLFQQADVFVFPTIEEGSALVTYEAMASGLPIITTPNAGSIMQDEQDGILVPIKNREKLATAIENIRINDKQRLEMGRAARNHIKPYTWDQYGVNIAKMVQQLLITQEQLPLLGEQTS